MKLLLPARRPRPDAQSCGRCGQQLSEQGVCPARGGRRLDSWVMALGRRAALANGTPFVASCEPFKAAVLVVKVPALDQFKAVAAVEVIRAALAPGAQGGVCLPDAHAALAR